MLRLLDTRNSLALPETQNNATRRKGFSLGAGFEYHDIYDSICQRDKKISVKRALAPSYGPAKDRRQKKPAATPPPRGTLRLAT
jgi:hypothetical protein